jgi:hypothetical protein
VIAGVLLLLGAGCGGSDDDGNGGSAAPTKNAYAEKGNTICRTAQTEVDALQTAQPPTLEDLREKTPEARRRLKLWTQYSESVDKIGRKSQDDLLGLQPPAELRPQHDQLRKDLAELDRVGAQANTAGEQLRAAARSGDAAALAKARAKAQKLASRQGTIADRIGSDFSALGWSACLPSGGQ